MSIEVDTSVYSANVRRYAVIAGKSLHDAVKEEAKQVAGRLMQVTPPKTAKIGKGTVERDISRVYLSSNWFLDVFSFKNARLGDRIKDAVRSHDQGELENVFSRSDKFRRIHIESLNTGTLQRFRKNGRVPKKLAPFSYPLADQGSLQDLIKTKQAKAGTVKAAWGHCARLLGGSVPGWLRSNSGSVTIDEKENTVSLVNSVPYAASLDGRGGFSRLALAGRESALKTKTQVALDNIKFNR